MHPDKSLSNIFDPLSPPVPSSPAPAYTALPYRDTEFHLAPLLHNKLGEVELETVDGKRFLVHKKVLESETVFFHIYYGFIPIWRVQANPHLIEPYHQTQQTPPAPAPATSSSPLNNLLCLPKILSGLRSSPPAPAPAAAAPLLPTSASASSTPPPAFEDLSPGPPGPPVPPKDITAPTPTTSPYTWVVPEHSSVLAAFLALVYPAGTFALPLPPPAGTTGTSGGGTGGTPPLVAAALPTLEMTSRVVRAALGYQSSKALAIARDRLGDFIPTSPVDVYALGCFFKFTDLAKLAAWPAVARPPEDWSHDSKALMGREGARHLLDLRQTRLDALRRILSADVETDDHSSGCIRRGMVEMLWEKHREKVRDGLGPASELLELLELDLRGGHCGDCLVNLGQTIQRCLLEAKELPKTV